jgi:hypothetical protein
LLRKAVHLKQNKAADKATEKPVNTHFFDKKLLMPRANARVLAEAGEHMAN